jgi:hypothetical protein
MEVWYASTYVYHLATLNQGHRHQPQKPCHSRSKSGRAFETKIEESGSAGLAAWSSGIVQGCQMVHFKTKFW